MDLNTLIGSKIAQLRKANNLTQEQLAEKLDISIKHCSAVERGLSCLSLEKLIEISEIFDTSLDFLLKNSSNKKEIVSGIIPESIIAIINSNDEQEISLLQEYLRMYTKLHDKTKL